jgi:hypothetical protein
MLSSETSYNPVSAHCNFAEEETVMATRGKFEAGNLRGARPAGNADRRNVAKLLHVSQQVLCGAEIIFHAKSAAAKLVRYGHTRLDSQLSPM